ncbi:hypothetical protein NX059_008457 [Plenodomus lindquistii]|nr:hypothetical protein NX059_008457 [Plenodomus lindquistii]
MPSLFARQNPLEDARITLSSWDNCMAKSYCKWPVIVGIIVGSLILISIITCIARCICCGAECACCCFRCCTCCCSGSGGRSSHKRMKSDPAPYPAPYAAQPAYGAPPPAANIYAQAHAVAPPPSSIDARPINQQYRSNAMPTFGSVNAPERPQFATFDSTRAVVNEDALPAMPTWKDGRDVHVEVEQAAVPEKKGDVELNRLDHNGSMASGSSAVAMAAVGGARKSPGPARSPVSPVTDSYGFPPGYQGQSPHDGFTASAVPARMNSGQQRGVYAQQDQYRQGSPGANFSGRDGYAQPQGQNHPYGRQSPGQQQVYTSYDQQQDHYNQHDQYETRSQHDHYNQPTYNRYNSPAPPQYDNNHYNSPAPAPALHRYDDDRYNSPAPPPTDRYASPAPPQIDYSAPAPAPQYPTDRYNSPAPPRSHTPGYAPSESTVYEPPSSTTSTSPAPAYPGQKVYGENGTAGGYPGQAQYQAFQPSAGAGTGRKAQGVDEGFGAY